MRYYLLFRIVLEFLHYSTDDTLSPLENLPSNNTISRKYSLYFTIRTWQKASSQVILGLELCWLNKDETDGNHLHQHWFPNNEPNSQRMEYCVIFLWIGRHWLGGLGNMGTCWTMILIWYEASGTKGVAGESRLGSWNRSIPQKEGRLAFRFQF